MKTFFFIFWNSVRGFRSYQLIFRKPLRVSFIYWFVFCFVIGVVVTSVCYYKYVTVALPEFSVEVAKNIPQFSFQNGQMFTSLPPPSFHNTNQFPIVLDPEGKFERPPPEFTNGMFHVGRTEIKIWIKQGRGPFIFPIKDFPNGKVDRDYIYRLGKEGGHLLAPFFLVVITLIFFVMGLLQALFFTALVSFLEKAVKPAFSFNELFNISVYSLTPSALIVVVYWLWGLERLPYDLIYFFTYLVFHVMGSNACRRLIAPAGQ